jgi:hypothetical protein
MAIQRDAWFWGHGLSQLALRDMSTLPILLHLPQQACSAEPPIPSSIWTRLDLAGPDAAQNCKSRRCGVSQSPTQDQRTSKKSNASHQPPQTGISSRKLPSHMSVGATIRRKVDSFATAMDLIPRTFRFTISIRHAAKAGRASYRIRSATSLGNPHLVS